MKCMSNGFPYKNGLYYSCKVYYLGYLMSSHIDHKHQQTIECVDKDPEYIPGEAASKDGSLFYFTKAECNQGLLCPPYDNTRALTCVVCTQ